MVQIALTGATGFVGRATLRQLLERGHSVRALARPGKALPAHEHLETIPGTLNDPQALNALTAECAVVIHVAGATSGFDYQDFRTTNVIGSRRLIEAVEKQSPNARLVHLSSLAAREPKLSPYAASKRDGEAVVKQSALASVIIRPPAVYGPEDPALRPLWQLLARGWLPRSGAPEARFSLLHVEDLASALVALAECSSFEHGLCCLHDGREGGYGWTDLARIASQARGKRVRTVPLPRWMMGSIARSNWLAAKLSGRRPPVLIPSKLPELAHTDWVCDNTQLPGCPEWKPIMQLEHSLADLPGWSRAR